MHDKIGFEEHFNLPQFDHELPPYANPQQMIEIRRKLLDVADERLGEMDAAGIGYSLLSLTAPGLQAVTDPAEAVTLARQVNDALAEIVAASPGRYGGMATLPLQDPQAAIAELERCATKLRFPGAMVNGFTDTPDGKGWYYDNERYLPFWERAESLRVPIYLHPRNPLPANAGIYEGHPELMGAVWEFTVETATHALRLFTSGLFDRFPTLRLVVGHLGEGLPFWMYRLDFMHRAQIISKRHKRLTPLKRKVSEYLRENVYFTTSGMAWEPAIMFTRSVVGADRVLYAMDYPYQYVPEEVAAMDQLPLTEQEKAAFFQLNAEAVFDL